MGFYSFYKIFKDLLRTFFGSKMMKIILALIIALMITSYIIPVFAIDYNFIALAKNTTTISDNGYSVILPSFVYDYSTVVVGWGSGGGINTRFFVLFTNDKIYFNGSDYTLYGDKNSTYYYVSRNNSNKTYDLSSYALSNFTRDNGSGALRPQWAGYLRADGKNYIMGKVYSTSSPDDVIFDGSPFVAPHFDNPQTQFDDLSFNYLFIGPADYGIEDNLYLHILTVNRTIEINQNETAYYYDDTLFKLNSDSKFLQYFTNNESYPYYSIPKYKLGLDMNTQYYFVLSSSGSSITSSVGVITDEFDDTVFQVVSVNTTGIITQEDVNSDNLQKIDDSLSTDEEDTLSNSDLQLPTMNIQDPSSSGFLGFFTILYNGFCSGNPTPLVIQLPYVDKTMTVDPDLTYNILTRQEWLPLYALIQTFYWFVISKFIMVSVRDIILHIKNIDFDVKNLKDSFASDIRRDML